MNQKQLIQHHLDRLDWSWYRLSKESGVPEGTLHRIRSERMSAKADRIVSPIAQAIGVDPVSLTIAGKNIPPDVEESIIRHPELVQIVRNLSAKLDNQKR